MAKQYFHLECSSCGAKHPSPMRESKYQKLMQARPDFYIVCSKCKSKRVMPPRQDDEIIEVDLMSFNGWTGYKVRKASPEEIESMARARALLERAQEQMRRDNAKLN